MRRLLLLLAAGLAVGAGLGLALRIGVSRPPLPDPPSVALQVREVARLETLEVSLYKKISYAPEPVAAGSFWGDVLGWARHALRPPRGRAIVFAVAHLGLDLGRIGPESLRVAGREIWVALPPLVATIELLPGETEVIDSNLDSAETGKLLELARAAFEREVSADVRLGDRARRSAERALRGLLLGLGFSEVHFVDALPRSPAG